METILLNPNSAAQNTQPIQEDSIARKDDDGDFPSIFDGAVADQENKESSEQTPFDEENESDLFSNALEESLPVERTNTGSFEVLVATNSSSVFKNDFATSKADNFSSTESLNSTTFFKEKLLSIHPQDSPTSVSLSGSGNELSSTTKVENILLQQIQQILDQDKNSGSIVITGTNENVPNDKTLIENLNNLSNPLVADSDNGVIQTKQLGRALLPAEDVSIATQKSPKLEGAQQEVSEQYFNAKLGATNDGNADQSQQNSNEHNNPGQQNKSEFQAENKPSGTTTISDTKPVESSYSQQLGVASTTDNQTVSIEGKFAPGANLPIPEKEIVNNLIQRFNVNPRLQTSKLTMQLHPAELGALKINILVENDSIKANIVAQSQQVIETLEKHMPRLRTVLEEQGFKVDSFEISMEGDSGKQKELFQEHFNSPQQEFASNGSASSKSDSFEALLDSQEEEDTEKNASGVNLTA